MYPNKITKISVLNPSHPGYALLYILLELTKDHHHTCDSIEARFIEIVCLHFMVLLAMLRFNEKRSEFCSLQQIREVTTDAKETQ